jgi:hypothetical protein
MIRVALDSSAKKLQAKRQALLDQLEAIDKALAIHASKGIAVANTGEPVAPEEATSPVVATRVKPQRVLSDEHRHAVREGRRKARHARDAAAGRAREMLDPSLVFSPASKATGAPRLVKRDKK